MTNKNKSSFDKLSSVEVNNKVRQKGNFWYVSWSNAVRELLKLYPDAKWEFTKFGEHELPYLQTEIGYFVECTVTVGDVSRTQMMPVLNHKNQTEMAPNASLINKTQMRALTKAIALHGFGLELWAGEDLDLQQEQQEQQEIQNPKQAIESTLGERGKTIEGFLDYASKQLKRDVSSLGDLTEEELQKFATWLENTK